MIKGQDIPPLLGTAGMAFCSLLAAAAFSTIGLGVLAPVWMWLSGALLVGGLVVYAFEYRCHRQAAPLIMFVAGSVLLWAGRYSPLGGTGWDGWPLWGSGAVIALGAFALNLRARSRFCVVRPSNPTKALENYPHCYEHNRQGNGTMNASMVYGNMTQEEIQQAYDQLAPDYDRMTYVERTLFGVDRQRRRLLNNITGRVLDVACGAGANFPSFHTASHITGIDLSQGMLDIARHKAERLGLPIDLRLMDAGKLEFADDSFDVVVSALSICTFPDPVAALREMGRVVRPDGRILLLEHGRSSWGLIGHHQDRNAQSHFEVAGCRWNQEPLDLVHAAGLTVTAHRCSFFGVFHTIEAHPSAN